MERRRRPPGAADGAVGAFDAVLEPGELAAEADAGPTVGAPGEAERVRPIVYLDRERAARQAAGGL